MSPVGGRSLLFLFTLEMGGNMAGSMGWFGVTTGGCFDMAGFNFPFFFVRFTVHVLIRIPLVE